MSPEEARLFTLQTLDRLQQRYEFEFTPKVMKNMKKV